MLRKTKKEILPEKFGTIVKWANSKKAKEDAPIMIPTIGGKGVPARMWIFKDILLIATGKKAKTPSKYVITKEKWQKFYDKWFELKKQGVSPKDYLPKHYREFGVTDYTFHPVILAISKAYQEDKQ